MKKQIQNSNSTVLLFTPLSLYFRLLNISVNIPVNKHSAPGYSNKIFLNEISSFLVDILTEIYMHMVFF
jgi:hypothetical protein